MPDIPFLGFVFVFMMYVIWYAFRKRYMTPTPYNFITEERCTQSKNSAPLERHRDKYGFLSLGYATTKQAASDGYKLRRGEAGKGVQLEFKNGKRRTYYNKDQFEWAILALD